MITTNFYNKNVISKNRFGVLDITMTQVTELVQKKMSMLLFFFNKKIYIIYIFLFFYYILYYYYFFLLLFLKPFTQEVSDHL